MNLKLSHILSIIIILIGINVKSQPRVDSVKVKLQKLEKSIPGLSQKIELSVSNLPLEEFVRNIASLTKLNINLATKKKQVVTNNFVDVPARDVIIFLCKYYYLDIQLTGNILHMTDLDAPIPPYKPKDLKIYYDTISKNVKLDLKNDSLRLFTKQLTQLTNTNIIFHPDLKNRTVSVYVQNLPLQNALDKLAIANNLSITQKDETIVIGNLAQTRNNRNAKQKKDNSNLRFTVYDKEHIDVYGDNVPIQTAIESILKRLNLNYFIFSEIKEKTNINLTNVSFKEFLDKVLNNTKYTCIEQEGIFVLGARTGEGLRETKLHKLRYRSVIDISKLIPKEILKEVSVKEFPDLNSLILSGSSPGIKEIENFINKIDVTVPLVIIELIIIDNQSGYTIETGITAGINKEPTQSSGQVFPGGDYQMGAQSVNSLINSFNGFGSLNLGKVNPNFYLNIKAMEDEGIVKVRSTPKLATLNGHKAEYSIGNTEYYVEQRSDFVVNTVTQRNTSVMYKDVKAEFKLTVTPVVSGNDQITMDIVVEQEDFTGRIEKNAPPGKVSRKFTSMIRVKNEDTILLGGLEEKSSNNSGRGVPVLSRIPILKWIFSNRKKEKKETKLNVFIKPTIIY